MTSKRPVVPAIARRTNVVTLARELVVKGLIRQGDRIPGMRTSPVLVTWCVNAPISRQRTETKKVPRCSSAGTSSGVKGVMTSLSDDQ